MPVSKTHRLLVSTAIATAAFVAGFAQADEGRTCFDALCHRQSLHGFEAAATDAGGTAPDLSAKPYGTWGIDTTGMNTAIKPGDDFFDYVNGKAVEATVIPADRTSMGSFAILRILSEARSKALVEELAATEGLTGEKLKVAMFYNEMMDQATKDALDFKPIAPHLKTIAALKTRREITAYMSRSFPGFSPTLFGIYIGEDELNPKMNTLYLAQGGTSLPDRDYYLKPEFADKKAKYEAYIAGTLERVGYAHPAATAKAVVAFETAMAEVQWTRIESRDSTKTYNPMTLKDLNTYAPGFDWDTYFKGAGVGSASKIVLTQNTAIPKIAAIWAQTPVETLKAWEAFRTIDDASPYLSTRFSMARWAFRSRDLSGAQSQPELWKRSVAVVEDKVGFALGKAYVEKYFPADSKTKMEALVGDLKAALKIRIENLTWMGPETKAKALEKLSKFGVKIGYPDKWFDYSKLELKAGDLAGNVERSGQFEWNHQLSQLEKPVDPTEWGMTPQTVNAYYAPTRNEIVFPAAILQPPFFNPNADPAVNYGAIGGVIGHEVTHGFDDQGRNYDGDGKLSDWWTAEDAAKFKVQTTKLGAQYDTYEVLPGVHVQGSLTMGENIADLGGLLMGLDAYRLSLKGAPAPVIDGFTGDQRVFLGFAQVWRNKVRNEALKQQVVSDPHSPSHFRAVGPTRNIDDWYKAFDVTDGKYYLKPEDRVKLW
jgi:putative endopeptidase